MSRLGSFFGKAPDFQNNLFKQIQKQIAAKPKISPGFLEYYM